MNPSSSFIPCQGTQSAGNSSKLDNITNKYPHRLIIVFVEVHLPDSMFSLNQTVSDIKCGFVSFNSFGAKLTDLNLSFLRHASNRISKHEIKVDLFRTFRWSLHLHRKVFKDKTSFSHRFPRCFDDIPQKSPKLIFASTSRCVFYLLNILFSCLDLFFIFFHMC